MHFVLDDAIQDIETAVQAGYPLTLVIVQGTSFCRLNVQITYLPVIHLTQNTDTRFDERGRMVYTGDFTLFAGHDPSKGGMVVESSAVESHVRGGQSSSKSKKPWKLSLKKANGKNYHADLLGMGADDDWILNPMNMDDTKLREKIMIDSWNRHIAASPESGYKMSDARYVELVLNGAYQGLYLLQRRVDAKYLALDPSKDILFKGCPTWTANSVQEAYELVDSPLEEEDAYECLSNVLECGRISSDNFLDVQLFFQFFNAPDNAGYKNMFYILKAGKSGYSMYLLPWDTDMSMGLVWKEEIGFAYDYEHMIQRMVSRMEYHDLKEFYPQLDEWLANRWNVLKKTMYSSETMAQCIHENMDIITKSGAYQRDYETWGFRYDGNDTWNALIHWCTDRINTMDQYYASQNSEDNRD